MWRRDFVEVYPTHVAGSLCGGNIGSRLSTTIGYERRMNQVLSSLSSSDEFVRQCMDLTDLPAVPPYWPRMRKLNTEGPPPLGGGMLAWRTAGKRIDVLPQWTVRELRQALEQKRDLLVLDVRQPAEWSAGHIPQAHHMTGAELVKRVDELPKDRPIASICGSGYRSSVAASVLKARGHREVYNVLGGMTGWEAEGFQTAS
jgi:rhodanese-related sulfurtransferase